MSLALLVLACGLHPAAPASLESAPQAGASSVEKTVDAGVREALTAYQAALESLDAEAVKKVQPSVDLEGLKRAFREMRALEVAIDNVRVLSSDGAAARISCRVEQTLTPRAGSRQTTTVTRVLRLRREGSGWVIQAFER